MYCYIMLETIAIFFFLNRNNISFININTPIENVKH